MSPPPPPPAPETQPDYSLHRPESRFPPGHGPTCSWWRCNPRPEKLQLPKTKGYFLYPKIGDSDPSPNARQKFGFRRKPTPASSQTEPRSPPSTQSPICTPPRICTASCDCNETANRRRVT